MRFDPARDDRAEPDVIEAIPGLVILEGWFLGWDEDGYDTILEHLDLLAYLDVDVTTSRQRRFAREAELNERGGGFPPEEMERFWDEVLGPGIERWTHAGRERADIVLQP